MKIYLHGDLQDHVYRSLFYGTQHWDDYIKFLVLEPSHEIGDTLREKLTEKKGDFLNKLNMVYDRDYELLDEPGIHIITSTVFNLHHKISEKNEGFLFYIFGTANLEPYNIFDNLKKIKHKLNCIFYTTLRIEEKNKKFDFGFLLRAYIANKILFQHFHCNEIFKNIKKPHRLDLSIRNFFDKEERMELFCSLVDSKHSNIHLRLNDFYLDRMKKMYELAEEYKDIDKLRRYKSQLQILDNLENNIEKTHPLVAGQHVHIGATKLYEVTFSSDIQILFESNTNEFYIGNEKAWCNITEKTIDNLLVEKPFIICSKVTYDFLKEMGFGTYENEFNIDYNDIFSDKKSIIPKLKNEILRIADMEDIQYQTMLDKCKLVAEKNREKCLEHINKNTILDEILNINKI
jgi:hypothetical protein